jgi:hypothetical protein
MTLGADNGSPDVPVTHLIRYAMLQIQDCDG